MCLIYVVDWRNEHPQSPWLLWQQVFQSWRCDSDLSDLSDFSDLRTEQSQFLLALDAQLRKYPANNDSIWQHLTASGWFQWFLQTAVTTWKHQFCWLTSGFHLAPPAPLVSNLAHCPLRGPGHGGVRLELPPGSRNQQSIGKVQKWDWKWQQWACFFEFIELHKAMSYQVVPWPWCYSIYGLHMLLQLELVTALVIRSSGLGTDLDSKSGGKRLANRIQSANGFISFHHVSPCFTMFQRETLQMAQAKLRDASRFRKWLKLWTSPAPSSAPLYGNAWLKAARCLDIIFGWHRHGGLESLEAPHFFHLEICHFWGRLGHAWCAARRFTKSTLLPSELKPLCRQNWETAVQPGEQSRTKATGNHEANWCLIFIGGLTMFDMFQA